MISRANPASRFMKAAHGGDAQVCSTWLIHAGTTTRSSGPSPTTW